MVFRCKTDSCNEACDQKPGLIMSAIRRMTGPDAKSADTGFLSFKKKLNSPASHF